MGDGRVALRDLSQPETTERNGDLVSSGNGWAEIELRDGGPQVHSGTPVELQTGQSIYLGHVESGEVHRLRVRVDHSLDVQDVLAIQKLWNPEQPD
jgi:hypothetical protein